VLLDGAVLPLLGQLGQGGGGGEASQRDDLDGLGAGDVDADALGEVDPVPAREGGDLAGQAELLEDRGVLGGSGERGGDDGDGSGDGGLGHFLSLFFMGRTIPPP